MKEMPFDVNLFNMEDPKVFKSMLDSRKGPDLWRKTYGFDFSSPIPGENKKGNMSICQQECLKEEYGQFAQDCKKGGGFFKCCMIGYLYWICCLAFNPNC